MLLKKLIFRQSNIRNFSTTILKRTVSRRWVLVKHFRGEPKPSDLKIVEEKLPAIQDGEFLTEAEYFSVDPYMRAYVTRYPAGITMIGSQVAKIIESKNPAYPVGARIVGYMGWKTHSIVNMEKLHSTDGVGQKPYVIPDFGGLPSSLALGALGMPGNTAYFGLLEICKPKAGETLVITGAAGAVGSHVGQIAKILGMNVIGIAGSDEKCQWLTKELGFDQAINYKTQNISAELKKLAPNGVDCYFDNVGGEISSKILYRMNLLGRVAVCGSISSYNDDASLPKVTLIQPALVLMQLKIEGFIVNRWQNRWLEGIDANLQWIKSGKLKYRETVTDGFDKLFDAFAGMLKGHNIGKAVVKA